MMRWLHGFVHFGREEADAVAAGGLAGIEREIGALEQAFGRDAVGRRQRDADRVA